MHSYNIEHFIQLESQVWKAFETGDAISDSELLTEDFLGVYESGFVSREEHSGQLSKGPLIAHHEISEARIKILTEGVVALSYRVDFVRFHDRKNGITEAMYVTSIWREKNGTWKNAFSQDTPISK